MKFHLYARLGRGDYNTKTTKVLHLSMNPESMVLQSAKANQTLLIEELEAKNRELEKLLEEKSSNFQKEKPQPPQPAHQPISTERQLQRLREVFKQKIKEFRKACSQMFGFQIDVLEGKQYRLRSMYGREDDFLLFKANESGMDLLSTNFSMKLRDEIDEFLKKHHSIPAFLSQITLQTFNNTQTQERKS